MLHRRQLAVQPHVDAQRGERAVRLALRDDEHRSAGLELAALGGRDGHHHGLRRHQDLLLAALVLHGHDAVVRHLDDVGDVRVGHLAVGPQIPVVVPFPDAAHALGEDVDLLGDQRAFALAYGRGANEFAAGDIVDARFRGAYGDEGFGKLQFNAVAVAGLHGQDLTVERLDSAADSYRRVGGRLGDGGGGEGREQDCGEDTGHGGLLFVNRAANAAMREFIPLVARYSAACCSSSTGSSSSSATGMSRSSSSSSASSCASASGSTTSSALSMSAGAASASSLTSPACTRLPFARSRPSNCWSSLETGLRGFSHCRWQERQAIRSGWRHAPSIAKSAPLCSRATRSGISEMMRWTVDAFMLASPSMLERA